MPCESHCKGDSSIQKDRSSHINSAKTPESPWIKVCGLTEIENAVACANLGADALGFVFFEKSPRNISAQNAAVISKALPKHIMTTGVFVNESYDVIMDKVSKCGLKGIQLHGNESPKLVESLIKEDIVVIKALFAAKEPFLSQADMYSNASFILVEYGKGILPGGNAESWNYELSLQLNTKTPVVLAGGLHPGNITQAIKAAKPAAVDVSSGVEKSYGVKDLKKVQAFIAQVKTLEK